MNPPQRVTSSNESSPATEPTFPPPSNDVNSPQPCRKHRALPVPRCQIPDWFDTIERDARTALVIAQQARDNERQRDERLDQIVAESRAELQRLEPLCAPHDALIETAHRAVNALRDEQRCAHRALADTGRLGRRHARAHLTDTETQLAAAEQLLERTTTGRRTTPRRPAGRPRSDRSRTGRQKHQPHPRPLGQPTRQPRTCPRRHHSARHLEELGERSHGRPGPHEPRRRRPRTTATSPAIVNSPPHSPSGCGDTIPNS